MLLLFWAKANARARAARQWIVTYRRRIRR